MFRNIINWTKKHLMLTAAVTAIVGRTAVSAFGIKALAGVGFVYSVGAVAIAAVAVVGLAYAIDAFIN